ncbi:MAG: dynamin family protein [Polyangiaceae bacterium]
MLEDFRGRTASVTRELGALRSIADSIGARSIAERIGRDLVQKLDEDRFHLVVVGEFNHGKSTFVNALLGKAVLPTGVTPTTATIHHLKHGPTDSAVVVRTGGEREAIAWDDVKSLSVGGSKDKGIETVDFVEVSTPSPLLAEGILLVDTPGVNDLSLQRADITYSYIPRADAVLFLLDAGQILKESERAFLQDKLLAASRDKIVFVVTKWDILSESERAEAFAYAKDQLGKFVPNPVLFAVSAERALEGDVAGSGMTPLVDHLTRFLSEERGRILLDNALGEGLGVAQLLSKGLDAKRRSIGMRAEELDRKIRLLEQDLAGRASTITERRAAIREEVRGIKVGARKDLERFVDDTIRQLPNVVDSAKGGDLKKYLPSFIEDTLKTWADGQTKRIASSLEELAERTVALVREDAHETTKRVAETLGGDVGRLEVKIDTFGYDVGVVALLTVGIGVMFANWMLGGLLTLTAPVVALFVRERVDGEYRKQAKELGPEVIRTAAAKIGPKLDSMIDEFAEKLDTWVVSAGEELHREVLEVLHATRTSRAAGGTETADLGAQVDTLAASLVDVTSRIDGLRKSLWTPPAAS